MSLGNRVSELLQCGKQIQRPYDIFYYSSLRRRILTEFQSRCEFARGSRCWLLESKLDVEMCRSFVGELDACHAFCDEVHFEGLIRSNIFFSK